MSTAMIGPYAITRHVALRCGQRNIGITEIQHLILKGTKTECPEKNRAYFTDDWSKIVVICSIDDNDTEKKPSILTALISDYSKSIDYVKADMKR